MLEQVLTHRRADLETLERDLGPLEKVSSPFPRISYNEAVEKLQALQGSNSTRFGKAAKWRRALDFASFLINCCLKLLFLPRQDAVVALTSPPLISVQ